MDGLRTWLMSVLAAAVLCALARALMPEGAVKRAGGLACGLVLLTAVLTPAIELSPAAAEAWAAEWSAGQRQTEEELRQIVQDTMKGIIEREFAAYIVDKAAEWGLTVTAEVGCTETEEGVYLPSRTQVSGPLSQEDRNRLASLIREDLGVPTERQTYHTGEELP